MRGQEVDQLYWTLGANMAPLSGSLVKAQTMLGGLTKAIKTPTGAFVTLGAVAAIAGIKATKMAAEFDRALREVSTLLPQTVEGLQDVRREIVALSENVPEPPAQLTKGLYQVISAGITDTTEAIDVLTVSSMAATAGMSDTFTAVDAITTVLNAYQLSTDQATRVSDVFFATIAEGKINFSQLAQNIGDVATTAALAGVSIEELGAAIATMTKFGISSSESMTALNRLFLLLVEDGEETRAVSEKLGIEFNLAAVRAKGFAAVMEDVNRATKGDIQALYELVPEMRAFKAEAILAGQGVDELGRILGKTTTSAGYARSAFEKVSGDLGHQWTLIKNKVNVAWYALGNETLPIVTFWLKAVNQELGNVPIATLAGLESLSGGKLDMALEGAEATVKRIRQEIAAAKEARSFGANLLTEAYGIGGGDIADLDRQLAAAEARMRTLEQLQARRNALTAESLRGEGPQLPPTPDLTATLDELERKLVKIRDASADVLDVDAYMAGVRELAEGMNAAADAAERMIMTQSSLSGAEADVQALVDANILVWKDKDEKQ